MLKTLLVLLLFAALGLALFSNAGDAQVMASMGTCVMKFGASPDGKAFCDSLRVGQRLWAVVFDAGIAMVALCAASLYLVFTRDN